MSNNSGRADEEPPPLFLQEPIDPDESRRVQTRRTAQALASIFLILLFMSLLNVKLGTLVIIIGIICLLSVLLRIIFCLCINFNESNNNNTEHVADVELESGRRRRRRHRNHRHRHHNPQSHENENGENDSNDNNDVQYINPLNLRLSFVDRDFTEDDYEVLLALDRVAQLMDNAMGARPQRGATANELNELPTHVYRSTPTVEDGENENSGIEMKKLDEERSVCVICLSNFEDGDVVTTTPCFHQFHKSCIDTWLAQKAVCPICKYELFNHHPEVNVEDDDNDDN